MSKVKGMLKTVYDGGFNGYAFLGMFRRGLKQKGSRLFTNHEVPDEILEPVLTQLLRDWDKIGNKFAWTRKVMQVEVERWWVGKQILEASILKNAPTMRINEMENVADVLKRMKNEPQVWK